MTVDNEEYPAPKHLREASRQELIGAIMVRAQVAEEIMREMIAEVSNEHESSADVLPGKPFGVVKDKFKSTFKGHSGLFDRLQSGLTRISFYELLDSVNSARNEAAHSHFLVAIYLQDVMEGYPNQESVSRLITKGIRKDAEGADWVLRILFSLRAQLFGEQRLFELGA